MKIRNNKGFTIVELLIVIVVIGLLAGLVITTFNGVQQKARDTERTTDIKALHAQLEAYYAQNGKYPTLVDMNDNDPVDPTNFVPTNLKGLDREAFKDPKGAGYVLVAAAAANSYSYDVSDGTDACDNGAGGDCIEYTLTATNEGTPATYSKGNLNN